MKWKDPFSTVTNLAYLSSGIIVACTATSVLEWVFALALVLLFAGSSVFHARKTQRALSWDKIGMFWVTPVLWFLILNHAWAWAGWFWIALLVCTLLTAFQRYYSSHAIMPIFAALICVTLLVTAPLIATVAASLFAIGYGFREAAEVFETRLETFRAYDALHAVWHIITGWGYLIVYLLVLKG